jgi:septation ring formation regulator EzrA
MELQNKSQRSLNNRLSSLKIEVANIESDLKKIARHRSEQELIIRKLRKEIQRIEMELEKAQLVFGKFEKDEFELNNNKRLLQKQIQEVMAMRRQ